MAHDAPASERRKRRDRKPSAREPRPRRHGSLDDFREEIVGKAAARAAAAADEAEKAAARAAEAAATAGKAAETATNAAAEAAESAERAAEAVSIADEAEDIASRIPRGFDAPGLEAEGNAARAQRQAEMALRTGVAAAERAARQAMAAASPSSPGPAFERGPADPHHPGSPRDRR